MIRSRMTRASLLTCWLLANCSVKVSSSNSTNPMKASPAELASVPIFKRPDALHISTVSRELKGSPGSKKKSKAILKTHDGTSNSSPATVPPREALRPPVQNPSSSGFKKSDTAVFYVVADSPYSTADASRLLYQMQHIPLDADFVVHLGDIRNAAGHPICRLIQYRFVSDLLRNSWAPVLLPWVTTTGMIVLTHHRDCRIGSANFCTFIKSIGMLALTSKTCLGGPKICRLFGKTHCFLLLICRDPYL